MILSNNSLETQLSPWIWTRVQQWLKQGSVPWRWFIHSFIFIIHSFKVIFHQSPIIMRECMWCAYFKNTVSILYQYCIPYIINIILSVFGKLGTKKGVLGSTKLLMMIFGIRYSDRFTCFIQAIHSNLAIQYLILDTLFTCYSLIQLIKIYVLFISIQDLFNSIFLLCTMNKNY